MPLITTAAVLCTQAAFGQVPISSGHVDVGIGYEDGWDLHIHVEDADAEYESDEAYFLLGPTSAAARPAGAAWNFLGIGDGAIFYAAPSTEEDAEDRGLPFIGIGSEEIAAGVFQGDALSLELLGVAGPAGGQFALFQTDAFGMPTNVAFSTADGISDADVLSVIAGAHAHFAWAFTAPGTYEVTLAASGTLADGTFTRSDPATYTFVVVPAPGVAAAAAAGLLACGGRRRR